MEKFDESKIKRDGDGKFAAKDGGGERLSKAFDDLGGARQKRSVGTLGTARNKLVFTLKTVADKRSGGESRKIVSVDLDSDIQKKLDGITPNEQRKIIFDYIMENLRGKYPADDGREIAVSGVTADKYTNKAPEIKLRAAPEIESLIKAAKLDNVVDVTHSKYKQFAYYNVAFQVGKDVFEGKLNIGIQKNGVATLYDLNPYNEKR